MAQEIASEFKYLIYFLITSILLYTFGRQVGISSTKMFMILKSNNVLGKSILIQVGTVLVY